jgi:hypothetical protein
MPAPSLVGLFIAPLNRAGIDYVFTVGLAAIVYEHPQLTLDVDLVMPLGAGAAERFTELWPPDAYFCRPADVVEQERKRSAHGNFNVIHTDTAMRADVYLAGDDPFQSWALTHHVTREVERELVRLAPIEYVLVYKLRYAHLGGSDRHLRDVARMLETSRELIRDATLQAWIASRDLASTWERAQELVERG